MRSMTAKSKVGQQLADSLEETELVRLLAGSTGGNESEISVLMLQGCQETLHFCVCPPR